MSVCAPVLGDAVLVAEDCCQLINAYYCEFELFLCDKTTTWDYGIKCSLLYIVCLCVRYRENAVAEVCK